MATHKFTRAAMCSTLACIAVLTLATRVAADVPSNNDTLLAIVGLMPRSPARVVFVSTHASMAPGSPQEAAMKLDAFVIQGDPRIFIPVTGKLWNEAKTSEFHRYAFAAVLWHEMAHLEGADEAEAQQRETELWSSFVKAGKVDHMNGARYAKMLRDIRDKHVRTKADGMASGTLEKK